MHGAKTLPLAKDVSSLSNHWQRRGESCLTLVAYLQPHAQLFYADSLDTVTASRGVRIPPLLCVEESASSVVIQALLGGKTKALQLEINGVICAIFSLPNGIESSHSGNNGTFEVGIPLNKM